MRRHKLVLFALLLTLLAFAPLISVLASGALNAVFGCGIGYGQAPACVRLGVDLRSLIVSLGLLGWLMAVSWVLLLPAAALWIAVVVRALMRRSRRAA